MPKKILITIWVMIVVQNISFAQTTFIEGRVLSANEKHDPLAFVKITLMRTHTNSISDIDGNWQVFGANIKDTLVFSYIGYATRKVPVSNFDFHLKEQFIYLHEKADLLGEVTIKPEDNPANRIMRQVITHKDENNYSHIKNFTYYAYTNMHALYKDIDSSDKALNNLPALNNQYEDDNTRKKTDIKVDSLMKRQYLFMIETIESVWYRHPGKYKKNVLAYNVSGIDDPRAALFGTAFENFNIYNDFIELIQKNYLSPIASNATSNYMFIIKDTIWTPEKDTVFVISFKPHAYKTFNGFQGTIYINSKNYVVQNIIASPAEGGNGFGLKIQQQFDFVQNQHWFPVQQDIEIDFAKLYSNADRAIIFEGRSSYMDIRFDTLIQNRNFSDVETVINDSAGNRDSAYWNRFRGRPLLKKEMVTYKVIDSISKTMKLDKIMNLMDALSVERIPIWKLDLDLGKVLAFNSYERYRLGLGLYTNDRISPYYSLGGYYDYGFGDHHSKYGGSLDFKPIKGSFFRFGGSYSNDVYEFGGTKFALENIIPYYDQIRYLGINDMYTSIDKSAYIRFSFPIHLQIQCAIDQSDIHTNDHYEFLAPVHISGSNYHFTEGQIGIRYAYKETIMKMPGKQMTVPYTKGPIIYFQYSRGLQMAGGNYTYDKYDFKINKKFLLSTIGYANVQVSSGVVNGVVPLFKEYNTPANFWGTYPIAAQNNFETVRINEFFDSRYINVFYKQTFAWHPYKNQVSAPVCSIREDIGYGQLNNITLNSGLSYKTMNKGYYESGLQIDNILLSSFSGIGIGIYYRYGPYSLDGFRNNLAIKLSFNSILLE